MSYDPDTPQGAFYESQSPQSSGIDLPYLKWNGQAGSPIQYLTPQGTWTVGGSPEHAESASYVQKAVTDPNVQKLFQMNSQGAPLNNEQKAFFSNVNLGLDSYGQSGRWGGSMNLYDNAFDPQQAGGLLQFGGNQYLSPSDISSGSAFNQEQSPAAQSARSDSGGLFGGDFGKLAMLAAAIYSGGAAGGLWGGLGEGAAGGFIDAIGSGVGAGGSITGALGAAGAGSGAMDWTDVLGEWPSYGDSAGSGMLNWQNAIPDFTNYSGQMSQIPGLEQTLSQIPNDLSLAGVQTALAGNPGLVSQITNWMQQNPGSTAKMAIQALGGGVSALGGLLTGNAAVRGAQDTASMQREIALKAFEQSRFQPVGITNNPFGTAQYQYDANGRLIGAQATPSAQLKAQQDALMTNSGQMLSQYTNAPSQFAPMGQAGQTAMALGNSYLSTTPQQQAQKYMADQQALLATGRERDMGQMLSGEFNRGTYGLATGGTSTGMGAANPRLEALMNANRQQDLGLATQATQGGMDYAKFGTGMVGLGGDLTKGMYTGQTAAYDPYKTALGGAQAVQGLGESALTQGMEFGRLANNTGAANTLQSGMLSAAQTQQKADSFSPWGSLLSGAGNIAQQYANPQQTQGMATYNPNQFRLVPFGS